MYKLFFSFSFIHKKMFLGIVRLYQPYVLYYIFKLIVINKKEYSSTLVLSLIVYVFLLLFLLFHFRVNGYIYLFSKTLHRVSGKKYHF